TLTQGTPEVTYIISLSDMSVDEVLETAAFIEKLSHHTLSTAILRKTENSKIILTVVENFYTITGKCTKAKIHNQTYYICRPNLFAETLKMSSDIQKEVEALQAVGKTVMLLGSSDEVKGYIAVADQIRPSSSTIIQKLYDLGIQK